MTIGVQMDLLSELMRVSFTEYEAKVYLALLREHPATGYQLSKQAGVPRSMVYEALGRLHTRGAVLKTEELRSTLYRPLPPQQLLDRYEREQSALVEDLRAQLGRLYSARSEDRLWSIRGRAAVLDYANQMIAVADQELMLVLADPHLAALGEAIRVSFQNGVAVSALLTGEGELGCGQIARHPPLESELQELTGLMVVVADDRECLIANTEPEMAATVTTNHNLVLIARQFVWMELFAQRIYTHLGQELINELEPEDRRIFESIANHIG